METKSFRGELLKADGDTGEVVAVFSRFNVIDHDGDVTLPGAFEDGAKTRVSAYNHGSSKGSALPVGKGVISQDGEVAIATMKFFLQTTGGRDTFEVVKELEGDGEWSYNYDPVEAERGQFNGKHVRFLKKLHVIEVSPVLAGAGIGTRTVSAKSLKDMSDDELAEEAERAFKALHDRGIAIPDVLVEAVHHLDEIAADLKRRDDAMRFIRTWSGIHEGATA